jgi:hypothetical protein
LYLCARKSDFVPHKRVLERSIIGRFTAQPM